VKLPVVTDRERLPRPSPKPGLDCVVIGHHDMDFHEVATRARASEGASAYYADLKLNSVQVGGKRLNYMDLFNLAAGHTDPLNPFRQPNLAVMYLTSFLRRRGLAVEPLNFFTGEGERLKALLAERPRAVAITTTFYVEPEPIVEIISFIRQHASETSIVVGGPYVFKACAGFDEPTQDYVLGLLGADIYIADSQGESSLAALLMALREGKGALAGVPNLIWRDREGTFQRSARQPENNPLDENRVVWSDFDPKALFPAVYLRTARSCPFACSFCSYPSMGGEHVVSEVEAIIDQLRQLRERGVSRVVFIDDTFNVPLPRFKKLLRRMVEERLQMAWMSFFRCSNADDETFELMRQSGCAGVFLGIESGDEQILGHMEKFAKVDRYRYGIRRLHEEGIFTYASMIVGFPGETPRSVERSIELIQESAPTFYHPEIYYHDVQAPIHQRAAEFQLRGAAYSWSHRSMDWREAIGWVRAMYQRIEASTLMGGYSLSCWGAFYLLSMGYSLEQLQSFLRRTRHLVLESWDEREASGVAELSPLLARGDAA
jgi:radical SAM PhpK family P-methyltransferase